MRRISKKEVWELSERFKDAMKGCEGNMRCGGTRGAGWVFKSTVVGKSNEDGVEGQRLFS